MKKKNKVLVSYEDAKELIVHLTNNDDLQDVGYDYIEGIKTKKTSIKELQDWIKFYTNTIKSAHAMVKELQKEKYPNKVKIQDETGV